MTEHDKTSCDMEGRAAKEPQRRLKKYNGNPHGVLDIAVDFDGTCVTHAYPEVGYDIGACEVLRSLTAKGHRIILCTMRSGDKLAEAVRWFECNGVKLHAVNENPGQERWAASRKIHADIYIDDRALGCPLYEVQDRNGMANRFVNWKRVARWFLIEGVFDIDDYMRCVAATSGVYGKIERLVNGEENESQS